MASPIARVQVSVNGGANQTGAVTVTSGQTVQPSMVSTSGVFAQVWELYSYPSGFNPGGSWALGPDGVTWQNTKVTPDAFSVGTAWGKWALRLRINGNPLQQNADGSLNAAYQSSLTDESTWLSMVSPNGLKDLGYGEATQFSKWGWTGDHQANLRKIDTALNSVPSVNGWAHVTGATTLTTQSLIDADTTAGAFTITMAPDANITDGFPVTMSDLAVKWATNNLSVTANTGWTLEDPANRGTYVAAGTPVALSIDGSVTWTANRRTKVWKVT